MPKVRNFKLKKYMCVVVIAFILLPAIWLPSYADGRGELIMELTTAVNNSAPDGRNYSDVVGVTHAAGSYYFGDESQLVEGAQQIERMGTKVIKLWLTYQLPIGTGGYPYNSGGQYANCKSLVDLAKTPSFSEVFNMGFHTYVLEAIWREASYGGMSSSAKQAVNNEMYDLTKHLMQTYKGTGKTFVLQNWEGDNAVFKSYQDFNPGDTRINAYKDWINARQAGVDKARDELSTSCPDVTVLHAMEINCIPLESDKYYSDNVVWQSSKWRDSPNLLIYTIVPYTDCDLYSYSGWHTVMMSQAFTLGARLQVYQDAIGETWTNAEGEVVARRAIDGPRIMLGEYGSAENCGTLTSNWHNGEYNFNTDKYQRAIVQILTQQALEFGVRYTLYWELYCNERKAATPPSPTWNNNDHSGCWLIRADGSFSSLYDYFKSLLKPETVLAVNEGGMSAANKSYEFDTAAQIFEVEATVSDSLPNLTNPEAIESFTGANGTNGMLMLEGSADGASYTVVPAEAFVISKSGGRARLVFINKYALDPNFRYLKVINREGVALTVEAVKVYRTNKFNVNDKIDSITVTTDKSALSAGQSAKLNAIVNVEGDMTPRVLYDPHGLLLDVVEGRELVDFSVPYGVLKIKDNAALYKDAVVKVRVEYRDAVSNELSFGIAQNTELTAITLTASKIEVTTGEQVRFTVSSSPEIPEAELLTGLKIVSGTGAQLGTNGSFTAQQAGVFQIVAEYGGVTSQAIIVTVREKSSDNGCLDNSTAVLLLYAAGIFAVSRKVLAP